MSIFSYIKPQLDYSYYDYTLVVCLSFPTSNHNVKVYINFRNLVVCLSFPTSNHNLGFQITPNLPVVWGQQGFPVLVVS